MQATCSTRLSLSAKVYKKYGQKTAYIRQAGFDPIKRADVMELCRVSKDQAYKLLTRLKNSGQITQVGSRKGAVYERKR